MDKELQKLYNEFCLLKDKFNSGSVTEKTVDIIGRFSKALKNAEDIVLNPPKVNRSFNTEFNIEDYTPTPEKEVKKLEAELKAKKAPKKKPGPKPKKK